MQRIATLARSLALATALFELIPPGKEQGLPKVDPLKYQAAAIPTDAARGEESLIVKLAFKRPGADKSEYLSCGVADTGRTLSQAGEDAQFAAAVACFGLILRDSPHKGRSNYALCMELAQAGRGKDSGGYRNEFVQLVQLARRYDGRPGYAIPD